MDSLWEYTPIKMENKHHLKTQFFFQIFHIPFYLLIFFSYLVFVVFFTVFRILTSISVAGAKVVVHSLFFLKFSSLALLKSYNRHSLRIWFTLLCLLSAEKFWLLFLLIFDLGRMFWNEIDIPVCIQTSKHLIYKMIKFC